MDKTELAKLNVDIEPFVLSQDDAIAYLKGMLVERFDWAIADPQTWGEPSDAFADEAKDIVEMAQLVLDNGYKWVKFEAHPMSPTGVQVKEMIEKGE